MASQFELDVALGNYYRTTGLATPFYDQQPDSLIAKTPTHMLGPRHVVQLLDATAGGGWARVRTEKNELGFVKFKHLKIVPLEEQPRAKNKKRQFWND